MNNEVILIDLDNTIIDTKYRKLALIQELLKEDSSKISIEDISKDYFLEKIFGEVGSKTYDHFIKKLESKESIINFDAPLFENVMCSIEKLINEGILFIVITNRPSYLREQTVNELKSKGLSNEQIIRIEMNDNFSEDSKLYYENSKIFKKEKIKLLCQKYNVIAMIGDRPEDIYGANENLIPSIIFKSTISYEELLSVKEEENIGIYECDNWNEIPSFISIIKSGKEEIAKLREKFTNDYSKWLSDIDNKCRTAISISAILSAIDGKIILDLINYYETNKSFDLLMIIIVSSMFFAVLSIIYAINGYTSRVTSGIKATEIIVKSVNSKTCVDKEPTPVVEAENLKNFTEYDKSKAHIKFFFERYHTFIPDALANIRLFELRATNYAKVYFERKAANCLLWSIYSFSLWFVLKLIFMIINIKFSLKLLYI